MNIEIMNDTVQCLEEISNSLFDIERWASHERSSADCGFSACAIGTMCSHPVYSKKWNLSLVQEQRAQDKYNIHSWIPAIADIPDIDERGIAGNKLFPELYGITSDEFDFLFISSYYQLSDQKGENGDVYVHDSAETVTRHDVINRLKEFIATAGMNFQNWKEQNPESFEYRR